MKDVIIYASHYVLLPSIVSILITLLTISIENWHKKQKENKQFLIVSEIIKNNNGKTVLNLSNISSSPILDIDLTIKDSGGFVRPLEGQYKRDVILPNESYQIEIGGLLLGKREYLKIEISYGTKRKEKEFKEAEFWNLT